MSHTLITFLGRGQQDATHGYREARYRFPGGEEAQTPYFGLALAQHVAPDHLVILGTSGSMWSVLLESHVDPDEEEGLRLAVMEAETTSRVDQKLVDRVAAVLSRSTGYNTRARLIPLARDLDEQVDILETIAREVKGTDRVSLDLTHGFRHFGMLGFLSSFMIERIERLDIDGLWYGALDMTEENITPVLRLDGLHAVQAWISALDRFDASGNYGVFAKLLEADGLPSDKADCLRRAAFHEATLNITTAAAQLRTALPALEEPLNDSAELFRPRLLERLRWAHMGRLSSQQRHLAMRALHRSDYQRCATLGFEAVITLDCEQKGLDPLSYDHREEIRQALLHEAKSADKGQNHAQSLRSLNQLRNALAHGTPPSYAPLRDVIKNPAKLKETLKSTLDQLLK